MLTHSFFEASVQDLSTLVPIMYVILLITAVLFLRSFWGMLITLVVIALSTSTAMGMAGWLGIPITFQAATTDVNGKITLSAPYTMVF